WGFVGSVVVASVALPLTWKTRVAPPPLTVILPAPRPLMVKSWVMLNSLTRVIVPFSPPANLITSALGLALATVIAARKESAPLSLRFLTVMVLGTARSSRIILL